MRELALHLLDIAENCVAAKARNVCIAVREDTRQDILSMLIQDDGCGMTPEVVARVTDAFYTTRTTRKVGLGLPLLKLAAEACNGFLRVESQVGQGTSVTVQFQRSHIDRMPLGDLAATFLSLLITSPDIHWLFTYTVDDRLFEFDDEPVKQCLEGLPMTEPAVLAYLRETIQSGLAEIQPAGSY